MKNGGIIFNPNNAKGDSVIINQTRPSSLPQAGQNYKKEIYSKVETIN